MKFSFSCLWASRRCPHGSWCSARCHSTVSALTLRNSDRRVFFLKIQIQKGWISFALDTGDVEICQQCYQVCFLFCFCANWVQLRAEYIQIKCWNVTIMSLTSLLLLMLHWCCWFVLSLWRVHDLTSLTCNQQTLTTLTDGARGATLYHILKRKLFAIIDLFSAVLIYFNRV